MTKSFYMKPVITLFLLQFFFLLSIHGMSPTVSVPVPGPSASQLLNMPLRVFLRLSAKDYCRMTGQKLTLKQKLSFGFLKLKMKMADKKNKDMTVGQFMEPEKKKLGAGWIILIVLGGILIILLIIGLSIGNLGFSR